MGRAISIFQEIRRRDSRLEGSSNQSDRIRHRDDGKSDKKYRETRSEERPGYLLSGFHYSVL